MRALATAYRMNWRKEGANYVLRDDNFSANLPAMGATPNRTNTQQRPNYNNNGYNRNNRNSRRGEPIERAPGVFRAPRSQRR